MPVIIDENGIDLDSEYNLETISNISGLILESWGPSTRNPKYNEAFDIIIQRLMDLRFTSFNVYVISAPLVTIFPNITDRAIAIDGTTEIGLQGVEAKSLRLLIGREQAALKANPKSKGGNRTKRILIHNKNIDSILWGEIANGKASMNKFPKEMTLPTSDRQSLENKVENLINYKLEVPNGIKTPSTSIVQTNSYERDPSVKAWVLIEANGYCEMCQIEAPFKKENGNPYLEVHHVSHLSEGGSDTIQNTVAVCPNCHMRFHYGADKMDLRTKVVKKVKRLISETGN